MNTKPEGEDTAPEAARKKMVQKMWSLLLVAVAICGGGWLAWSPNHQVSAAVSPALPRVTVSKPLVRNLAAELGFLGQFSAVNQVEIRAQVGGILTGIFFKDGAVVQKGDLLFSVDPEPYEIRLAEGKAQLETATAKLSLANREYARARELEQTGAGTVESVDQRLADRDTAKASVDSAKAQIRDAQFDLDHCRIRAPFAGRIGTHQVSVGNLIAGSRASTSPTTLLTTLVSLDPIYMNFDMSEADFETFSSRHLDQKTKSNYLVRLSTNGDVNYSKRGILDFVDNVIDRASGTIRARATVPNKDLTLTPGQFARVKLAVTAPEPTILVPDSVVQTDQSERVVMVVSAENTIVPKKVILGELQEGLRVIRSGLSPTDDVVIDGIAFAAPGLKVEKKEGVLASTLGHGQD